VARCVEFARFGLCEIRPDRSPRDSGFREITARSTDYRNAATLLLNCLFKVNVIRAACGAAVIIIAPRVSSRRDACAVSVIFAKCSDFSRPRNYIAVNVELRGYRSISLVNLSLPVTADLLFIYRHVLESCKL
jgi:hypothetical protein